MQQRTRRLAITVGGTLVASIGLVLAACSTDNGTSPLPGQADSGRPPKEAGSSGSSGGDHDGDAPLDDGGAVGADCGNAPWLHNNDKGGFYCAFFRDGGADAGGLSNCSDDQTCCNPGESAPNVHPPSFCAATPAAAKGQANSPACATQAAAQGSSWPATGGHTWECGDKNNCAAGKVCCLYSEEGLAQGEKVNIGKHKESGTKIPAACNAQMAYKYGGSRCADACDADEIPLCSLSEACVGGKTCAPFEIIPGGRELGYCK